MMKARLAMALLGVVLIVSTGLFTAPPALGSTSDSSTSLPQTSSTTCGSTTTTTQPEQSTTTRAQQNTSSTQPCVTTTTQPCPTSTTQQQTSTTSAQQTTTSSQAVTNTSGSTTSTTQAHQTTTTQPCATTTTVHTTTTTAVVRAGAALTRAPQAAPGDPAQVQVQSLPGATAELANTGTDVTLGLLSGLLLILVGTVLAAVSHRRSKV